MLLSFSSIPHHRIVTFLRQIINFILDYCLAWFLPKWRRKALLICNGATKYVNYKRDILPAEKIRHIEGMISKLKASLLVWNKEESITDANKLETVIDALPGSSTSSLAENVEVLFVILVIFLGIKDYIVQPFRIPTGSMYPSLNGIRVISCDEEPGILTRLADAVTLGSSYVDEKADTHQTIVGYRQSTKWLLFTRTTIVFNTGATIDIPSAQNEVSEYFVRTKGTKFASFTPGETIIKARIDAGDLILVDKISYHFRKPKLGEVFVFNTNGIIPLKSYTGDQANATHYVKRLCGLPGQTLTINRPNLLINGKNPDSWTIRRVEACKPPYNPVGYNPVIQIIDARTNLPIRCFLAEGQSLRLKENRQNPLLNQYAALGDNTTSSLDSRYWGPVSQYNIVGPAAFALWPFTSHWGLIP